MSSGMSWKAGEQNRNVEKGFWKSAGNALEKRREKDKKVVRFQPIFYKGDILMMSGSDLILNGKG
jgi:hypothetical protein